MVPIGQGVLAAFRVLRGGGQLVSLLPTTGRLLMLRVMRVHCRDWTGGVCHVLRLQPMPKIAVNTCLLSALQAFSVLTTKDSNFESHLLG